MFLLLVMLTYKCIVLCYIYFLFNTTVALHNNILQSF